MISHKYKCIFIHIPKTAGTSIETALGHFDCWQQSNNRQTREGQDHRSLRMLEKPRFTPQTLLSLDNISEVGRAIRHQQYRQSNPNNKLYVNARQYQTYFKFSIVRNPWSRVFSCYCNVLRDKVHRNNLGIAADLSLKEFVARYLDSYLLRPQTYWLKNFAGKIDLDYIGRFESLERDFTEICRILELERISLPHTLKGSKQDYREQYDRISQATVARKYREEIELFNYSFDS